MIDQAGIMMAQGALIASERIIGVNDNMAQSHYHEYFELYYLETGERFHMVQDRCYKMTAGEFIIFPPYVMHYSYGEKDMPFKRLVLYFRQEELGSDEIFRELSLQPPLRWDIRSPWKPGQKNGSHGDLPR